MKVTSPRFLVRAFVAACLLAMQSGVVGAQILNNVNEETPIPGPTDLAQEVGGQSEAAIDSTVAAAPVESPVAVDDAEATVGQMENVVETVGQLAEEIVNAVEAVAEEIQETAAPAEQTTAPVEQAVDTAAAPAEQTTTPAEEVVDTAAAPAEQTGAPVETGGQVAEAADSPQGAGQTESPVTAVEATVSEVADPIEEVQPELAGPVDAVEVLGGVVHDTVATVEETVVQLAGPIDAVEVLGGVVHDTAATVEETVVQLAGPIDAVEVLGGVVHDTAATVEETVVQLAGPIDAVEVLGGVVHDTAATVEETVVQLAGPIDAVEVLGGVVQDTVSTVEETADHNVTAVEETAQEIVLAVESLEGHIQDTVHTVEETTQPIADSVEVLKLQVEETINTTEQLAERGDVREALHGQIEETATVVEATTQQIVDVLEALEVQIEETITTVENTAQDFVAAADTGVGATEDTVGSVEGTVQQTADVVEVLHVQVEKAVTTVEATTQQIVDMLIVLGDQVANADKPVDETTPQIVQAMEGLVGEIESPLKTAQEAAPQIVVAVEGLVEEIKASSEATNAVQPGQGLVSDPVNQAAGAGELVLDPVGQAVPVARGESSNPVGAAGGVVAHTNKNLSAAPPGATGSVPTSDGTEVRASFRSSATAAGLRALTGSGGRFVFGLAAILGASQPSLAILVDAVNDADGDGIFSDNEIAPVPGADVNFKVLITNIGAVSFEIDAVQHSYNGRTGPAQGTVCAELVGIMLSPGESLACAFPVSDYAPPIGQSLVNTVMAAGFEVGKDARRGASDSDTSTVETLAAGDDVLAVAIKRNLAFTGTDAARLLALGLLLVAAGGAFLSVARIRSRRPVRPLPSESPAELLGWWAAGPGRSHPKEKVGQGRAPNMD